MVYHLNNSSWSFKYELLIVYRLIIGLNTSYWSWIGSVFWWFVFFLWRSTVTSPGPALVRGSLLIDDEKIKVLLLKIKFVFESKLWDMQHGNIINVQYNEMDLVLHLNRDRSPPQTRINGSNRRRVMTSRILAGICECESARTFRGCLPFYLSLCLWDYLLDIIYTVCGTDRVSLTVCLCRGAACPQPGDGPGSAGAQPENHCSREER